MLIKNILNNSHTCHAYTYILLAKNNVPKNSTSNYHNKKLIHTYTYIGFGTTISNTTPAAATVAGGSAAPALRRRQAGGRQGKVNKYGKKVCAQARAWWVPAWCTYTRRANDIWCVTPMMRGLRRTGIGRDLMHRGVMRDDDARASRHARRTDDCAWTQIIFMDRINIWMNNPEEREISRHAGERSAVDRLYAPHDQNNPASAKPLR